MVIAIFVGAFSALVGMVCWSVIQFMLSMPGVYEQLGQHWYIVPPAIGVFAACVHTLSKTPAFRRTSKDSARKQYFEKREALADLFESYHFGKFILHPLNWVARASVSIVNAFLGGTFGLEGGVLELNYASLPVLQRYTRFFVEEKQTFVICIIAASLGVALGAPFAGALIALELVHAIESRVRASAVLSALIAYGAAMFLQATLLPGMLAHGSVERHTILGSLVAGLQPMSFTFGQWFLISAAAIGIGIGSGFLAMINSRLMLHGSRVFDDIFGSRFQSSQTALKMILTGVLIGVSVWFVPESFSEPWRTWDDLAWLRLSSKQSFTLLVAEWSVLIIAFSGWGTSGLFSPMLLLGSLFGYGIGNLVNTAWALPLAVSGGVAVLSASFRIPIAASALALEVGRDGPVWWLATLAVLSSALLSRYLKVKPLHEILLARYGIRIVGGRAANVLADLKCSQAMYRDFRTIFPDASIQQLRDAARASQHNFLGVISKEGKYIGILALEQLPAKIRKLLHEETTSAGVQIVEKIIEIRDLIESGSPTILPDESLEKALLLLQDTPCVAVVNDEGFLNGFVFESSIAGRYKREIANALIRRF